MTTASGAARTRPVATPAPLPHNTRWDEISAQILARQEADRRKQPKTKPA